HGAASGAETMAAIKSRRDIIIASLPYGSIRCTARHCSKLRYLALSDMPASICHVRSLGSVEHHLPGFGRGRHRLGKPRPGRQPQRLIESFVAVAVEPRFHGTDRWTIYCGERRAPGSWISSAGADWRR